jgi:hypothetical protein
MAEAGQEEQKEVYVPLPRDPDGGNYVYVPSREGDAIVARQVHESEARGDEEEGER